MAAREHTNWPQSILSLQSVYQTAKTRAVTAMDRWEEANRFFVSLFEMGAPGRYPSPAQITQAMESALDSYQNLLDAKRLELEIGARLKFARGERDRLNSPSKRPPPKADA
jgi:hypothetical protein